MERHKIDQIHHEFIEILTKDLQQKVGHNEFENIMKNFQEKFGHDCRDEKNFCKKLAILFKLSDFFCFSHVVKESIYKKTSLVVGILCRTFLLQSIISSSVWIFITREIAEKVIVLRTTDILKIMILLH